MSAQYVEKSKTTEGTEKMLNICISGASNPFLRVLLAQFCDIEYTPKPCGIAIKLYDRYSETKQNAQFIKTIMEEFSLLDTTIFKTIEIVQTIGDGLKDCDLFVIADYFRPLVQMLLFKKTICRLRFSGEVNDLNEKIVKKMSIMLLYADEINAFAKRSLRIVLASDGPDCFNATVLVETCTRIRVSNIVAVTSDIGISHLNEVSKQTGMPIKDLGSPPVWGFIGINQYVDLDSIIQYSEVYIPFMRALNAIKDSTLPPGKMKPELRFSAYLLENNEQKFADVQKRQVLSTASQM